MSLRSTVLVTGGAGFIGSALINDLNQRGVTDIIVADYLGEDEKWKNLVPLQYDDYLEADHLLECLNDSRLANVKTVYHLGAQSATTELDCRYLIQNNYEYTRRLAEWSLDRDARFVYASSAATYGDGEQGMSDDADLSTLRPLNMYGYSKHMFDCHAQRQGWLDRIVGLKYFNVFGPNEGHKGNMRSVVHKSFEQIQQTGQVKLFKSHRPDYGDGEQQRDFLYVKAATAMTIHLAHNRRANGLFNLGSGTARTWVELVTPVFEALGLQTNIEFIDMPESLREKYQYYTCADITKLKGTDWQHDCRSLSEAVHDYVSNYLMTGRSLGDELPDPTA